MALIRPCLHGVGNLTLYSDWFIVSPTTQQGGYMVLVFIAL